MKCYRIKHTPTGLYYQPSRGGSNFSVKGKIYASKPTLKRLYGSQKIDINCWRNPRAYQLKLIEYFKLEEQVRRLRDGKGCFVEAYVRVPDSEWEIEEIQP